MTDVIEEPRDSTCGAACPKGDGTCGCSPNHCAIDGGSHICNNTSNHVWDC